MSLSSNLYRLQQTDSQLDRSRQRLQAIADTLQEDSAIRQANQQVQTAQEKRKVSQKALRQIEAEVEAQNVKIELTENSLYGGKVRNPKELQDLQNEAAALKRHLSVLEDRQIEAMLQMEEAEAQQNDAENNLQQITARMTEEHAGLKGEQSELLNKVERLEVERQAALGSIQANDLALYEQLRKQRHGVAVAKISQTACSACGSILNTAIKQSAAAQSQLALCPTCGRILYAG